MYKILVLFITTALEISSLYAESVQVKNSVLADSVGSLHSDTATAFEFLDKVLEPESCAPGREYAVVSYGGRAGFAAQFQLSATEFICTLSHYNYRIPVLLVGPANGYSEGPECNHADHDWTCFFRPISKCQKELLSTGKRLPNKPRHLIKDTMVPKQFAHKGLAWWWGIIQLRMFRLQPYVEQFLLEEAKKMGFGRGFPFGSPIAGLHIRHGDKSKDGWKEQSFDVQVKAVRKSPECSKWKNLTCYACACGHQTKQGGAGGIVQEATASLSSSRNMQQRADIISFATTKMNSSLSTSTNHSTGSSNNINNSLATSNNSEHKVAIVAADKKVPTVVTDTSSSSRSIISSSLQPPPQEEQNESAIVEKESTNKRGALNSNAIKPAHQQVNSRSSPPPATTTTATAAAAASINSKKSADGSLKTKKAPQKPRSTSLPPPIIEGHGKPTNTVGKMHSRSLTSTTKTAAAAAESSKKNKIVIDNHSNSNISNISISRDSKEKRPACTDQRLSPMSIFIASDNLHVAEHARSNGYLVGSSGFGVSQQTGKQGMWELLKKNPAKGFNASIEIITDMFFLSHCTTLVGIASSQVFRAAVDMSMAQGLLQGHAIAMDYDQLPRIRKLSDDYDVAMPEEFLDPRTVTDLPDTL